ncbi:PREDICTED: T-cell surface glycoprotein CD3 zeta chain [Condylura cristata]|uniref:T-cell surface glycoprotein CD3 zeta chain n=1 Tax=Condylura cristata TaxID=143302 RepID=UPI000334460F|nr:PREDICTED: T-cell surface glycoprotein CD3 zeta chain [Condylura cristata]
MSKLVKLKHPAEGELGRFPGNFWLFRKAATSFWENLSLLVFRLEKGRKSGSSHLLGTLLYNMFTPGLVGENTALDVGVPEAQIFGLLDPKLCYLLDGILFIYGLIITALFLRAKFSRNAGVPMDPQSQNLVYNELNLGRREEYDVLDKRRGRDPEMGGKQQRRKNPQEAVYNALQKDKMAEAYSEIGKKAENQRRRGKGNDGLYQGLSTATKDTYDALHMQALPPR